MGTRTWEPVGLKWPDIQWKGWCDARRYRCVACGHEQAEWEPFNHKPTCKHAAKSPEPAVLLGGLFAVPELLPPREEAMFSMSLPETVAEWEAQGFTFKTRKP